MTEAAAGEIEGVEEVDAIVVREPAPVPVQRASSSLATRPAALATTSFVAGVATAALVVHRRSRKASKRLARSSGARRALGIAGSRSFLVDVHLLNRD